MSSKLMIPGPVSVEDEVLEQMGAPVQPHYGLEGTAIYNETRDLMKQVFRTRHDVHLLVGSGTAGLDAAVGSITIPGDVAIIGTNGFFGDRQIEIAESYGLQVEVVSSPLSEPLDPSDFEAAIARYPEAAYVSCVHLETATSVINPLKEIAAISREHGIPVLVDAVSSLGGIPFEMDEWGIDLAMTSTQKCLGAPPGLGPIAISDRAWAVMDRKPDRQNGWYLNLQTWRRYAEDWGKWHPFPVTMATNNVLALRAGLQKLLQEGIETRFGRYTELAKRLRAGLREIGLEPFTPDDRLAPVLTAVLTPEGATSSEVVKYMLQEHDIRVSGGLGEELKDKTFRIGHMSPKVGEADIDLVLSGLAEFMSSRESVQEPAG